MDDDLMSLRGSKANDDDLFGSFADPDDLGFDAGPPPKASSSSALPDLEALDFSAFEGATGAIPSALPEPPPTVRTTAAPRPVPAAKPPMGATAKAKAPQPRRRKRGSAPTGALGLTPLQQMVLSIFLFLDVAVLGFLILLVIGAISL